MTSSVVEISVIWPEKMKVYLGLWREEKRAVHEHEQAKLKHVNANKLNCIEIKKRIQENAQQTVSTKQRWMRFPGLGKLMSEKLSQFILFISNKAHERLEG